MGKNTPDKVAAYEELLRTAIGMGADQYLLRPLRVNIANQLEESKAWRAAAKARRELFGLALPDEELKAAARCQACASDGPRLRCSRCRQAFFCNEACQKKAWPIHRHECSKRDEAAERE